MHRNRNSLVKNALYVLYVYDRYTRSNYVYKDPSVNVNATHKPDIVDNYLFLF